MADKKSASNAPKYSREELLANAEAIFAVKPEVLAGALHGREEKEFTIDEVKSLVNKFLERKVK